VGAEKEIVELKAAIQIKGGFFEGKSPEYIVGELGAGMEEAVLYLERLVKKYTPQGVYGAQGGLLSTIHGEVEKGTPVMKGVVGHQSPHGDVIEKGRTAGKAWPPSGALLRWIELKMGVSGEEAKRIEFLVRRKIGKKGFPGVHMFERAFDEGFETVQTIFEGRGFEIAKKMSA
jgi:hypothetical protein